MPDLMTDVPVVVLNPHYSGLGIARDLGPIGVDVLGVTAQRNFPGNCSRWLRYRASPDSFEDPKALCEFLVEEAQQQGTKPVLFPTRDHDVAFIARNREHLAPSYRLAPASPQIIDTIMNKSRLSEIAKEAGICVPQELAIADAVQLEDAAGLQFPVVCKPPYAALWRRPDVWQIVGRSKVVVLRNLAELDMFYRRVAPLEPRMLVQEWVAGGDRNLLIFGSYCAEVGVPNVYFTARKRLQYPPLSGDGMVVEATPIPEVVDAASRLLGALGYRGISEIEFKWHSDSQRLYLIEINPRHWDQHRLGSIVGVNLSEAAYRDATDQPQRSMDQRPKNALWIADQGFARQVARSLTGRAPMRDACEAFGAERTWGVFDPHDIQPFLKMVGLRR